jgi:hypothetical protein
VDDLVQFLRDRLDEDEALAVSGETWSAFEESSQGTRRVDVDYSIERVVACTRAWRGLHIARHHPARVLAEVEAKRDVVARYEFACKEAAQPGISEEERETRLQVAGALQSVVLCLAAPYADHPDYREEWRP